MSRGWEVYGGIFLEYCQNRYLVSYYGYIGIREVAASGKKSKTRIFFFFFNYTHR